MAHAPTVAVVGTRGYPSYYGGLETAVRKLAPYLVERGWEVTVHGRRDGTRDDDPGRDGRVNSVPVWALESKSLSNLSSGLASTLRLLREPPDVALVMSTAIGLLFRCARRHSSAACSSSARRLAMPVSGSLLTKARN